MNFIPVEGFLSTNMFESIRNKKFSENICFVMAYYVWKEIQNERIFFSILENLP